MPTVHIHSTPRQGVSKHTKLHTSSALSLNRQEEGKNIKGKILGKEQLKTQRNPFNVTSLGVCNRERQKWYNYDWGTWHIPKRPVLNLDLVTGFQDDSDNPVSFWALFTQLRWIPPLLSPQEKRRPKAQICSPTHIPPPIQWPIKVSRTSEELRTITRLSLSESRESMLTSILKH